MAGRVMTQCQFDLSIDRLHDAQPLIDRAQGQIDGIYAYIYGKHEDKRAKHH